MRNRLALTGQRDQGANLRDSIHAQSHIHVHYFSLAQHRETFAGAG
jgi:hypothetical protein